MRGACEHHSDACKTQDPVPQGYVGSNPTPRTCNEPTEVQTLEFGFWLLRNKKIKETTIERKLKAIKTLAKNNIDLNDPCEITTFLNTTELKAKGIIRDSAQDYLRFKGLNVVLPKYKKEFGTEMYVPNPSMVRQFLYRIRNVELRTKVLMAVETGASAKEICGLTWENVNLVNRTITIIGVKGHKSKPYEISEELLTLLMQIPRSETKVFKTHRERHLNDNIIDYRKRLAKETGNTDFLKIHFHTFRHYAISWKYFKCKDLVETQRFARHCNVNNTTKYIHIVKSWVKENEFETVYAETKEDLTKYLSEGYTFITKTEWGYALTKPKSLT